MLELSDRECVASRLLLMKDRKIHAYVEQRDCPKNCQKDQKKLWTASLWALLSCLLSGRCDLKIFFLFSFHRRKSERERKKERIVL